MARGFVHLVCGTAAEVELLEVLGLEQITKAILRDDLLDVQK